jgi:protein ImuB
MYACIYLPGLPDEKRAALKQCAQAFSPQVEDTQPDLVMFDIRGLRRLFGEPYQIATAISSRAAELCTDLGTDLRIAIASNPNAARAAARGYKGITVIPPGQERRILGSLPLNVLSPTGDMLETLDAWGVHTFAELAALPERGIFERLGNEGLRLQKQARGIAARPLVPATEAAKFEASMELEHPLELLEPLSFVLSRLLNEICSGLSTHSLGTNQLDLTLTLEDKTHFTRSLRLPFASRDANAFLKLLQYDLAAHPPEAAILAVHLKAHPAPPRVTQSGLFLPLAPQAEKLELTLARITAVVGEQNAGTPELLDTHRPSAFHMKKFETKDTPPKCTNKLSPHLAIRLFRPPLPATVLAPFGHPQRVTARGVAGTVVAYAGPWRTSGDWWTTQWWDRDEWDIALQNGALYRIYCEAHQEWYVEGNYD